MSSKLFVCQDGGFFEAVHTFANFEVCIAFVVEEIFGEIVFVHDLVDDVATMDAHILENRHFGAEKEVFYVDGAVSSAFVGVGDGAVEMEFDVSDAHCWGAYVLVGVEFVAADRHADTVYF